MLLQTTRDSEVDIGTLCMNQTLAKFFFIAQN